jgi:hypothetical protein
MFSHSCTVCNLPSTKIVKLYVSSIGTLGLVNNSILLCTNTHDSRSGFTIYRRGSPHRVYIPHQHHREARTFGIYIQRRQPIESINALNPKTIREFLHVIKLPPEAVWSKGEAMPESKSFRTIDVSLVTQIFKNRRIVRYNA